MFKYLVYVVKGVGSLFFTMKFLPFFLSGEKNRDSLSTLII